MDSDQLLRFAQAAKLPWIPLGRSGKKISISTFWRWMTCGYCGVKLKVTYVGASPVTTEAWIREFFDSVAQARLTGQHAPSIRTPTQRARDIAAAERELAGKGIGRGAV